jgi:hypothetical protein
MLETVLQDRKWIIRRMPRMTNEPQSTVGLPGGPFSRGSDDLGFWTGDGWASTRKGAKLFGSKIEANMHLSHYRATIEAVS